VNELDRPRYWVCIAGPVPQSHLPKGAYGPPRQAAKKAIKKMSGKVPNCWSGWIDQNEFDRIVKAQRERREAATETVAETDQLAREAEEQIMFMLQSVGRWRGAK